VDKAERFPSRKGNSLQHYAVLLLCSLALNLLLGELALQLSLPLYLDALGTTLLAVACGPLAGAACGALTSAVWELWRPGMIYWAPSGAAVGLCAGWCMRMGLFRHWATTLMAGGILAAAATLVSVPIRLLADGALTSGEGVISQLLIRSGKDVWEAVISTSYLVELTDKVSISLLARTLGLGILMLRTPLGSVPLAQRLRAPDSERAPFLAVVGGFLGAGGLYLWFFLHEIVSTTPQIYDHSAYASFIALARVGFGDLISLAAAYSPLAAAIGGVLLLVGLIFRV
jgi:energy-coupling factor transport system substrate-specific component